MIYDLTIIIVDNIMQNIVRTPKQAGAILRRIRRNSVISQGELGEKAGLWQETISKVENGAPGTRLETIFAILAALDLELIITPRSKSETSDLEDIF